jgi:diacylglycerol kinase
MINFIKARLKSLGFACKGLEHLVTSEKNIKIHLAATLIAIVFGIALSISFIEWLFLIVAIALVWISETFNTAIERLCDLFSTQPDPKIALIKDLSAAAVLLAAVAALIIGCYVFIPHFFR